MGTRDSGRCGASKFGSAAIFLFPPAHPRLPAFGRGIYQEHDYISSMPVQLKDNHRIVIIVTGVAIVKVARENSESAHFYMGPIGVASFQFPEAGFFETLSHQLSSKLCIVRETGFGTRVGAAHQNLEAPQFFYSHPPTHGCRPSAGG